MLRKTIAAAVALAATLPAAFGSTDVAHSRPLSRGAVNAAFGTQTKQRRTPKKGWLLVLRDRAPATIATASHYLAWEYESLPAHPYPALIDRDSTTGKTRELASAVSPQFGLAATATYVVYATQRASVPELRAVRHDGSAHIVLSRALATPFASRGSMVAWAEQRGSYQQVVVRNMVSGREWVAARMRRCEGEKCYRIDAVSLADDGVVFDRGAIGTQPSRIVRCRFGSPTLTSVSVANDPQPELAPSSAGAVYNWLGHGWMRWDFASRRPRRAGLNGVQSWVVAYEHGRLLVRTGSQCRPRLTVRLPDGRTQAVPVPASTPDSPKDFGPLCSLMTDAKWRGHRLLVSWAVIPRISLNAHTDAGLTGAIIETRTS